MLVKLVNDLIDEGCLGNGNSIGGWIVGDGNPNANFAGPRSVMSHLSLSCDLKAKFILGLGAMEMISLTWTAKMTVPVGVCCQ